MYECRETEIGTCRQGSQVDTTSWVNLEQKHPGAFLGVRSAVAKFRAANGGAPASGGKRKLAYQVACLGGSKPRQPREGDRTALGWWSGSSFAGIRTAASPRWQTNFPRSGLPLGSFTRKGHKPAPCSCWPGGVPGGTVVGDKEGVLEPHLGCARWPQG